MTSTGQLLGGIHPMPRDTEKLHYNQHHQGVQIHVNVLFNVQRLGIITPTYTPFTLGSGSLANIEEEGIFEQIPQKNCKSGKEGGKERMKIVSSPCKQKHCRRGRLSELTEKGASRVGQRIFFLEMLSNLTDLSVLTDFRVFLNLSKLT